MSISIKNRWTEAIIFTSEESTTLGEAVRKAIAAKVNLSGSDLRGSNLRGSNLRDSDLSGSDLRGSNLRGSNLRGSNLRGSNLSGSNLSGSNLRGSNLSGSIGLENIRNDFWDVLIRAPHEIAGLREAVIAGKIDGSTYEGNCACLVGTIAKVKDCGYKEIPNLAPDSSRPIERFFTAISPGNTPQNNGASKIVLGWIDEFLALTSTVTTKP